MSSRVPERAGREGGRAGGGRCHCQADWASSLGRSKPTVVLDPGGPGGAAPVVEVEQGYIPGGHGMPAPSG